MCFQITYFYYFHLILEDYFKKIITQIQKFVKNKVYIKKMLKTFQILKQIFIV